MGALRTFDLIATKPIFGRPWIAATDIEAMGNSDQTAPHVQGPCRAPHIAYSLALKVTNTWRGAPGSSVCAVPVGSLLPKPLLPMVEM